MTRSKKEIEDLAKVIVNRVVADAMDDFPKILQAVHKLPLKKWNKFLDDHYDDVLEMLLSAFGSSD